MYGSQRPLIKVLEPFARRLYEIAETLPDHRFDLPEKAPCIS